jgi:hypothetical protein
MRIMTEGGTAEDVVVVRESSLQRDGLYGFLTRAGGDELRFVTKRVGRLAFPLLFQSATATTIPLRWFTRASVRKACESTGWHFVPTGAAVPQ